MTTTFYKVVMNGQWGSKDIKNLLYYRAAIDPFGGMFGWGGAETLAARLEEQVVPHWLDAHTSAYKLDSIDIYPYNELLQPVYQLPYHAPEGDPGTLALGLQGTDGAGVCVNIRFNLEPRPAGALVLTAPKRGYIAFGPILSEWVDNTGKLMDQDGSTAKEKLGALCTALSENIESLTPPALFYPIRASSKWGLKDNPGFALDWGYADIGSAFWSPYCSYRRSRKIVTG